VLLSCAIGDRLYPDPQWKRLAATWRAMYPLAGLRPRAAGDLIRLAEILDSVRIVRVGN
jgi:hypothetical protein